MIRLIRFEYAMACAMAALLPGHVSAEHRTSAVFIADPQIHNVYGGGIKQEWIVSDFTTGVAQRPPELNLLAPYVLSELLDRASGMAGPEGARLVVILGDTTNVACSNELERYQDTVDEVRNRRPGQLLLAAHGNHDSYLMGTVNSYVPTGDVLDQTMARFAGKTLPVDASWWSNLGASIRGKTWGAACASPDNGLPLNKGQWMARYAGSLRLDGLTELQQEPGGNDEKGYRFTGSARDGSALHALDYTVTGRWYPPMKKQGPKGMYWDLQRVSRSYLVQAIDLGEDHRLVLLDSSTCKDARGGKDFISSNAGSRACLGRKQLEDIAEIVGRTGKRLVFAGHYPFDRFEDDRANLQAVMASKGIPWTYISAHTHRPRPVTWHSGGVELNIGSTTDWPMEASVIEFGGPTPSVHKAVLDLRPTAEYRRARTYQGSELCRHLAAAEKLKSLSLDGSTRHWASPGTLPGYLGCRIAGRKSGFERLAAAEKAIAERIKDQPGYKERVLEIAAAASLDEYRRFNLADLLEGP